MHRRGDPELRAHLRRFLTKLVDITPRKHSDYRTVLERGLEKLSSLRDLPNADSFLIFFEKGLETRNTAIVETCLRSMEELVVRGYVSGNKVISTAGGRALRQMDKMVDSVCQCSDITNVDKESSQLCIIRLLMALSTSPRCQIHADSLVRLVICCLSLHVRSKSMNVRTSAVATMTQTVSFLLQRCDAAFSTLKRLTASTESSTADHTPQPSAPQSGGSALTVITEENDGGGGFVEVKMAADESLSTSSFAEVTAADSNEAIIRTLLDEMVEHVVKHAQDDSAHSIASDTVCSLVERAVLYSSEKTADKEKKRGNTAYSKKNYAAALFHYRKAHELCPDSPVYLVNEAITHYVLDNLASAKLCCMDAVRLAKSAMLKQRFFDVALPSKADGFYAQWCGKAYSTLAHVAFKERRVDDCIRLYELSLSMVKDAKIEKKLAELVSEVGTAEQRRKRKKGAVESDEQFWDRLVKEASQQPGAKKDDSGDSSSGMLIGLSVSEVGSEVSKLQKDTCQVLEELCKIAGKRATVPSASPSLRLSFGGMSAPSVGTGGVGSSSQASMSVKSNLSALSLIEVIVKGAAKSECLSECGKLLDLIRREVVPMVAMHVSSMAPAIVESALKLFRTLMQGSKNRLTPLLSGEIGMLFDSLLTVANSSSSTFDQKKQVLRCVDWLIKSSDQRAVWLFLNYDCHSGMDESTPRLFEKMVSTIERMSQIKGASSAHSSAPGPAALIMAATPNGSHDWVSHEQSVNLRGSALLCLTDLCRALLSVCELVTKEEHAQNGYLGGSEQDTPEEGSVTESTAALISTRSTDEESVCSQSSEDAAEGLTDLGSSPVAPSLQASELLESFSREKKRAAMLRTGIVKFNIKPSHGIRYLTAAGLVAGCSDTSDEQAVSAAAKSIAAFLWANRNHGLDPVSVGDYLGGDDSVNRAVMTGYISLIEFGGMDFVDALRLLCACFMLPGEGQKIDRIMQTWAEHYCALNPEIFPNADTAYILAFSTILLHSNLHNSQVKKKMTLDEFVSSSRSCASDAATEDVLSVELLTGIYDNIAGQEMKLSADAHAKGASQPDSAASPARREQLVRHQSRRLVRDLRRKLKSSGGKRTAPIHIDESINASVLRLMFEELWATALAMFSVCLKSDSSLAKHVSLALDGYRCCIEISGDLAMDTQCDAFVGSLSRFTLLTDTATAATSTLVVTSASATVTEAPSESKGASMTEKNIGAIQVLLDVAFRKGSQLKQSWADIIRCISEIEGLFLVATGAVSDFQLYASSKKSGSNSVTSNSVNLSHNTSVLSSMLAVIQNPTGTHSTEDDREPSVSGPPLISRYDASNENARLVVSRVSQSTIDQVFSRSSRLNSEAIVHFTRELCTVSRSELLNHDRPRVFCLQKIVDLAHYNMDRVRLVWLRLWKVLSQHFVFAATQTHNLKIAMYAVDSLRQLASKFLEKPELSQFEFQSHFLKTFGDVIEADSCDDTVAELVMECLATLVKAKHRNIKSGWLRVFEVIATAANQTSPEHSEEDNLVVMAFDTLADSLPYYLPEFDSGVRSPLPESSVTASTMAASLEEDGPSAADCRLETGFRVEALPACVKCLLSFVEQSRDQTESSSSRTDVSVAAIDSLRKLTQYLFSEDRRLCESEVPSSVMDESKQQEWHDPPTTLTRSTGSAASQGSSLPDLSRPLVSAWFACLSGLSRSVTDKRLEVRTHALQVLIRLIRSQGSAFDQQMWQRVFQRLLFGIFRRQMRTDEASEKTSLPKDCEEEDHPPAIDSDLVVQYSWMETTCHPALSGLIEILTDFFPQCRDSLFDDTLSLLFSMVNLYQSSEEGPMIAIRCLGRLVEVTSEGGLRESEWQSLMDYLTQTLKNMADERSSDAHGQVNLAVLHELTQTVCLNGFPQLSLSQLTCALDCLEYCNSVAQRWAQSPDQSAAVSNDCWRFEVQCLHSRLSILRQCQKTGSDLSCLVSARFVSLGVTMVDLAVSTEDSGPSLVRRKLVWPVLQEYLDSVCESDVFSETDLSGFLPELFPHLTRLIVCDSLTVRTSLSRLLRNRVRPKT